MAKKWKLPEQHKINVDYYNAEYYLKQSLNLLEKCKKKFTEAAYTAIASQIEVHLKEFRSIK